MKDNIKHFKKDIEPEDGFNNDKEKDNRKVVTSVATCPACRSNNEGVLKIPAFDALGVEGLRVCKNCGIVFMEKIFLEMILDIIDVRNNDTSGKVKIQ